MSPHEALLALRNYLTSQILGQERLIDRLLIALLADGHLLVEGAPGLAKTKAIKYLADGLEASFQRIQFTPDLLPSDITGTDIYRPENANFEFQHGPIFHNLILADEINRAPAKVQSALLEAMAEHQVSVGNSTYPLTDLFLVMATQNPIEMEGTYPLPEAQLDRFLCKVLLPYPKKQELMQIMERTTGAGVVALSKVMDQQMLLTAQQMVKEVMIAQELLSYAVDLVMATNPDAEQSIAEVKQYVQYGSGPRGVQSVIKLAKARALVNGRFHVSVADIKSVLKPALRHRLLLNYEGEAAEQTPDSVLDIILQKIQQGVAV